MLILFLLSLVSVDAKCVYQRNVARELTLTTEVAGGFSDLFGLFPFYNDSPFTTKEQCVDYCNSQSWCFGTSELSSASPTSASAFCQFHTDFAALGFYKPGHYDCKHNINFNCEFQQDYLLDIGGRTFAFTGFDSMGARPSDVILPEDVIGTGVEGFCDATKTIRNENGHSSNSSFVYSRFYGTAPVTPNAWAFNFYDTEKFKQDQTIGNPGLFASNGVSRAHRGFPIRSVAYWDVNINQDTAFNFSEASRFSFYRNEYVHSSKCVDTSSTHYIDRQALKSEKTYFHIKMHGNQFLNCDPSGCTWESTPNVVWSFAPFSIINSKTVEDRRFGADNTIIAHDPTTKEEIGWLAADMPEFDEDVPPGTIRLKAGNDLTDEHGVIRGVGTWNFYVAPSVDDQDTVFPQKPMHGTSLCYTAQYIDVRTKRHAMMCVHKEDGTNVAKASQTNADLTLDATIVPNRTEALLHYNQTGFSYSRNFLLNDGTARGGDNITAEHVDDDFGGHLFEVYSDSSKRFRLKCEVLYSCKWVLAEKSDQLFKFNFNGQTDSEMVKIDFVFFKMMRGGDVSVYDKDGSFYVNIGTLIDSPLGIILTDSTKMDAEQGLGLFKRDNTFCSIDNNNGVRCLKGGSSIKENEKAMMVSTGNSPDTPGYPDFPEGDALFVPVVDHLVLEDANYKWVTDGSGQCPPHHYVHQVRCVDQKRCDKVDVGCMKDKPGCSLDGGPVTIHELEHSVFTSCPPSSVVTAIDTFTNTITCSPITIDKDDHPSAYQFPTFSNIGTVISPDVITFDATNARVKKWRGPVPIKSLVVGPSFVTPFVFGEKCFRDRADSTAFKTPGAPAESINTASDPSELPRACKNNNGFISFIRCLDENDCSKGLEFFCDDAPKCRYDGDEKVHVTNDLAPTCPFGTVITGLSCINTSDNDSPCSKLRLTCRPLVFDDSVSPSPSPSPGDDKSQTKIIIISLSVGIPLLIVAAILCLCCIPDVDDTPENRARDTTSTEASVEPEPIRRSTIRKRHIF